MKKLVFTFKRIDHPAQDLAVKFHGFLMEQLDSDYVDYLHQQQTNPYATKVIQGKENTQWVVHLLTDDIEDKVFMTLLQIKEVSLNDLPKLSVEKVEIQELGTDKLLEIFNSEGKIKPIFQLFLRLQQVLNLKVPTSSSRLCV